MSISAEAQQRTNVETLDAAGGARQVIARRRRARAKSVAATATGALLVWFVVEVLFGTDLRAPAFSASQGTSEVGLPHVLMASLSAGVAGWGVLAALERFTSRARTVWVVVAGVALLVSLGSPLSGTGITSVNRALLVLLHGTVAAILIPSMYRTIQPSARTR